MQNNKYGLLSYSSVNIGDEIQSLAASRFLPKVNDFVPREQINNYVSPSKNKIKLIMNAWWMWQPENFLPSSFIDPLLISMHINESIRDTFLNNQVKDYLTKYGPVGCRDLDTCNWLIENGVPAYFSSCLTITLQRSNKSPRKDYILCVNESAKTIKYIRSKTDRPVYNITKNQSPYYTFKQRFELAKIYLRLINDAHCIVSHNVHTCLPALGLGTPVLRVVTDSENQRIRWSGMEDFVYSVKQQDLLSDNHEYDFEKPKLNPENHLKYKEDLIKRCSEFTGFNNDKCLIYEDDEPLIKMFQLNNHSKIKRNKILYFCEMQELKQALEDKKNGVSQYNIIKDENELKIYRPLKKLEKIFSVKNKYEIDGKYKVVTFCGKQYEFKPLKKHTVVERERERERERESNSSAG